jgi:hypothetical protein
MRRSPRLRPTPGSVPLQERERDLALDVGEDGLGAGSEGLQGGGELVAGGHALADEFAPGPHHRPQRPGWRPRTA